MQILDGDITEECSIQSGFVEAEERFGPATILIVNSTDEETTRQQPIWDLPLEDWEKSYKLNVRGSFLAIKHFLRRVRENQQILGSKLASPSIVVMETETHAGLAAGKAGLHYGLLQTVRNEILQLTPEGRINAVAPGKNINASDPAAGPRAVAPMMAFLASKRASGHISGQCIEVEGKQPSGNTQVSKLDANQTQIQPIPRGLGKPKRNKIRVAVSIDLDAVSGWLGTSKTTHSSPKSCISKLITPGVRRTLR